MTEKLAAITRSENAFTEWLDEPMRGGSETRREFAQKHGINVDDLDWAFSSGYMRGRSYKVFGKNE